MRLEGKSWHCAAPGASGSTEHTWRYRQPFLGRRSVLPIPPVRGRAGRRSGAGWEKLEPTRFSSLPAIPRDLRALLTMVAVFQRAALPWNRTESPCAPTGGPAARAPLCPDQRRSPRREGTGGEGRGRLSPHLAAVTSPRRRPPAR